MNSIYDLHIFENKICPICFSKVYLSHTNYENTIKHFLSERYFGIVFDDKLIGIDEELNIKIYNYDDNNGVYGPGPKSLYKLDKIDLNISLEDLIQMFRKIHNNLLFV